MTRYTKLLAGALVAYVALFCGTASAAPQPGGFQQNDATGFNAILPPGANGFDNAAQLLQFEAAGTRPLNSSDQRAPYANLVHAAPGLSPANIGLYYHPESFGVPSGQAERTYSPRGDVTIVRDSLGVPHVYGATREGAMFGLGYVAAEDRLFFMDALRYAGRGELSSFAGGGNRSMDEGVWASSPYTEADLVQQYNYRPPQYAALTDELRSDVNNYVAGINQYISEARADPINKMPAEYAAIGRPGGPVNWTPEDVIATASLIGGIFGTGGGGQLDSALTLQQAQQRFGRRGGRAAWHDFREANDPEAPLTVHRRSFPYEIPPKRPRGMALPDPGSVQKANVVARAGSSSSPAQAEAQGVLGALDQFVGAQSHHAGASNALVVSAKHSQGGHPVAVFGPQVAYFAPEILMEEDIHAPGIDARGAAFPGVNLFVELGRGRDYAWSATSAGQGIVDTFAVPLCDPGGGAATMSSQGYLFRGRCVPFEVLNRTISWSPNLADQTPAGSETLRTLRSALGIVIARGRVHGTPVAYTELRSTYFHEVDSAAGFMLFNDPSQIRGPRDFQRAASLINYTFNWFYVDAKHTAYFNSGWNPVRAKRTDPNLPMLSSFEWRNYDPAQHTETDTAFRAHPQVIDQNFMTSWNNKQAHRYSAADNNWSFGPVYRSTALDERVRGLIRGRHKATPAGLIGAMEGAATTDLRGHTVLPFAIRIMRSKPITDPALRGAVNELSAWAASGAHRIDANGDGHYEYSDAIRLMDAWWYPMLHAEFEPTMGKPLFDAVVGMNGLEDTLRTQHEGDAFDGGWYVYANKDLRAALRLRERGRFSRVYCGGGRLARCRIALLDSLKSVLNVNPYGENAGCGVGDQQMCSESIHFRGVGAITQPDIEWQNRPTFQQVVQIPHSVPR